jgi:amino acid adenylation domain-containing protein/non-ribosomal peptide synthase protein (TIGR01720 family)
VVSAVADRIAALPPEKRRLLELRLRKEGLASAAREAPPPPPPIRRRRGPGPFPLTFGQQRLWFIEQMNPGTAAYNIPFAGRLRGALDPRLLERALREVVRRHEVLRTRFVKREGVPVQVVDPEPTVRLPVVDLAALSPARREAEAARLTAADPQAPFDLARGPVLRVTLIALGGEPPEHVLLVTMPHLVTDAWSMAILFRELPALYDAFRERRAPRLPELPIQVADYALWEREWLDGEVLARLLAFWEEMLAGAPVVLDLPTDRPRPAVQSARGERRPLPMPRAQVEALHALGERAGVTLFMTLLAGLGVLLERWTGQGDVLIGSPVVTRSHPETYPLIGFFISNVVLRVDLRDDPTFAELLARVRSMCLQVFAHQDVPFDRLVDALGVPRDPSRPPLVQVNFVLQNVHIPEPEFAGIRLVSSGQTDTRTARFDLSLGFFENDEGLLEGGLDRATDLFDATTIDRMGRHWLALLAAGAADPGRRVSELPALLPAERHQLLVEWNDTSPPAADGAKTFAPGSNQWAGAPSVARPARRAPAAKTFAPGSNQWAGALSVARPARRAPAGRLLHELVLARAAEMPGAPALAWGTGPEVEAMVSYGELAARVAALAHRLRALGVGPEERVAVCLERSPELIVSLLAALAAGGVYLPLDPGYPRERLLFLVRDAGARLVVSRREVAAALGLGQLSGARLLLLDEEPAVAAGPTVAEPLPCATDPDQLAYVIYTSGSTGAPKGVAVPHRALGNLALAVDGLVDPRLRARPKGTGLGPGDAVLQFSSPSFDASLLEITLALTTGATLHRAPREALLPGAGLVELLRRRRIRAAILTPSVLAALPEDAPERLPDLDTLTTGAEPCPPELAARWSVGRRLVNLYGPTEATVIASGEELPPAGGAPAVAAVELRPPIGWPLANVTLHVLDRHLRPVPLGAHGELCIGGGGVARGYLGRPDLTAASFLPDPWSGAFPGARLYRTGDRVRRLADGRLDFLGRLDDQVKVRGQRVELGEVEAALAGHPALRDAAVVLRHGRLVGYVVPRDEELVRYAGAAADAATAPAGDGALGGLLAGLRAALRERLPEFMLPAALVPVAALPRTPAGKVDRAALPEPDRARPAEARAFVPPRTPEEERLAAVWTEVLGVERVGAEDDFFALGGDSILGIRLVARAAQEGLHLEPRQVFEHPTLAAQAASASPVPTVDAEQGPVTGPVPLTPIQRWFFAQELPAPGHWNLALLLTVESPPAPAALPAAVARLLAHHDMLRARFARGGAGWRQEIAPPGGAPPAQVIDLSTLAPAAQRAAVAETAAALQASLDLAAGPLLRVALFALGAGRPARLLVVVHHLVIDGISWRLLLEDLTRCWQALGRGEEPALPPKTTSFRRWAERLADYAWSAELRQELPLWSGLVAQAPPALAGFAETGWEGRTAEVETALGAEETTALLAALPERLRARLEEALLAAVAAALAAETGTPALLVEVEGHGREPLFERVDVSRSLGWFTAPFPLLVDLAAAAGAPAAEGGPAAAGPTVTLAAVKQALRRLPHRGIGCRLLRYLGDGEAAAHLARLPRAPLSFNYLGKLDEAFEGTPFALAPEGAGPTRDPRAPRPHALEVTAFQLGGRLHVTWSHDRALHPRALIERLAERWLEALRALAAVEAAATPADFPHAGLAQADLDRLLARVGARSPSPMWERGQG